MLNPDFILRGYAAHHLATIWNALAFEADLQCEAVLISKLRRLGKKLSNSKIAECVLQEPRPNALLILHDEHWLLAHALLANDAVAVADSIGRGNARNSLSKRAMDKIEVDGFALLASGSKILACVRTELDA